MFQQAKQSRTFEDIISQIQESVLDGTLQEGDRLPGERTLREAFKVSRGTLREALRALEQKGLVTIKTGVHGGAFICINNRQMSEGLDLLLRHQRISLRELAESREAIEGFVAAKAARNAQTGDLRQLRSILETIRDHLDAKEFNWKEVIVKDSEFHLCLVKIAGNRVFESILDTLYKNINRYFERFLSKGRDLQEKNYQDLCRIVEAVEKRDSKTAQALVQDHVRYFNRIMEKGKQTAGQE